MYSKKLKMIMSKTVDMASAHQLKEYSVEMLVSEILQDEEVRSFLESKSISVENILGDLDMAIVTYIEDKKDQETNKESATGDIFTSDVLARASLDIEKSTASISEIDVFNILSAVLMSEQTEAFEILDSYEITRSTFREKLEGQEAQDDEAYFNDNSEQDYNQQQQQKGAEQDPLKGLLISLNDRARQGKIDPMIGRQKEIHEIATILARKTKNNPVITGNPGVGKTAVIEGLAKKIVDGDVVEELKGKEIFSLNLGAMLAGTKYRGEFEQRVVALVEKMKTPNAIIFIDEIHTIIGAGSSTNGTDMSNLLKPHLTSGELTVIGATTNEEYVQVFEKNGSLARRFNEVKIKELGLQETIELLHGIKGYFASHHSVDYQEGVMEEIVKLSNRYISQKHFPDKAIDLLDQISAEVRLDKSREPEVKLKDVLTIVSRTTGVPMDSMEDNSTNKVILDLESVLKEKVFGQDSAIEAVSESMMLSYAGLKREDKPIGSFLCVGPTGVGKTELAKVLSNRLNMPLIRYDMSEFMEKHSVSRLLGSTAGYVGYEEGGQLLRDLRDNPYSVVLFDEYEKAHPDLQNIFLQILDEGFIKDAQGRLVDFRNTIILFTSNAGVMRTASELRSIGFKADHAQKAGVNLEEIEKRFTPEFRNRLSATLKFNPLNEDSITFIAEKAINQIVSLLEENKGIKVSFTKEVAQMIGTLGFDPAMGARPIERKADDLLSKELAKLILSKGLSTGDKISVLKKKGKEELSFRTKKVS